MKGNEHYARLALEEEARRVYKTSDVPCVAAEAIGRRLEARAWGAAEVRRGQELEEVAELRLGPMGWHKKWKAAEAEVERVTQLEEGHLSNIRGHKRAEFKWRERCERAEAEVERLTGILAEACTD